MHLYKKLATTALNRHVGCQHNYDATMIRFHALEHVPLHVWSSDIDVTFTTWDKVDMAWMRLDILGSTNILAISNFYELFCQLLLWLLYCCTLNFLFMVYFLCWSELHYPTSPSLVFPSPFPTMILFISMDPFGLFFRATHCPPFFPPYFVCIWHLFYIFIIWWLFFLLFCYSLNCHFKQLYKIILSV